MRCPHLYKSRKTVRQHVNNLVNEETGVIKSQDEITIDTYEYEECLKENCAAWIEGVGCNFYGEIIPINEDGDEHAE